MNKNSLVNKIDKKVVFLFTRLVNKFNKKLSILFTLISWNKK